MFANRQSIDPLQPSINDVLSFLTFLVDSELSYSALNTARSALSACVLNHESVGSHPLVKRFMKGVFELRPALPKYQSIWDPAIVLKFLESIFPLQDVSLKMLTLKLCMLIALCTGQRCQSIHLMDLDHMTQTAESYTFVINSIVTTSKPGKPQPVLVLPKFENTKLCVVTTLNEYIIRTRSLRSDSKLFLSFCKPYKSVTKATISRWVRTVMSMSGIDTDIFQAHSTRTASTSVASVRHVPLTSIMTAAHWSKECTFRRFYQKPVTNDTRFAKSVLTK